MSLLHDTVISWPFATLTNLMNGIITVFLINECIENVEVLVSLFLFFDPSPVWEKKDSEWSLFNMTFVCWCHVWHNFWKVSYLCLNVCTLTLAPESSGHIATYIPILCLMSALSHLWRRQQQVPLLTSNQCRGASSTYVFTHQLERSFFCMWTTDEKWHLRKCHPSLKKNHKVIRWLFYYLCMCVCFVFKPVSALYSFPKIHTGSVVSGKSSISPNRSVSYVKVAVRAPDTPVSVFQIKDVLQWSEFANIQGSKCTCQQVKILNNVIM